MGEDSFKQQSPESVAPESAGTGQKEPIDGSSGQTAIDTALIVRLMEQNEERLREQEKQARQEKKRKAVYRTSLLIAIIIIIILLLRGCSGKADYWWVPDNSPPRAEEVIVPELEDSALVQQTQEAQEEYETPHIDIPVIQSFVVSKSAPYKDLYNPETNAGRYYLQYEFTVIGESEPFYQSKLVEGGYQFSVDFGSLLEIGEYRVNVATNTFEYGSLAPKSGDMHEIQIIVTE